MKNPLPVCYRRLVPLALLALSSTASQVLAQVPANAPAHLPPNAAARIQRLERQSEETRETAKRLSTPLKLTLGNGRTASLRGFAEGNPIYVGTMNAGAADTISTDRLYPGGGSGTSLRGTGQMIGLWDGGDVLATHPEFAFSITGSGTVTNLDGAAVDDHATHVAGTLIAHLNAGPTRGMAPDANVRAYDFDDDIAEMTVEAGALTSPLRLSNHSYGARQGWDGTFTDPNNVQYPVWWGSTINGQEDFKFGWYGSFTRDLDLTAGEFPKYLIVKSAGNARDNGGGPIGNVNYFAAATGQILNGNHPQNSGYDTMETLASAKNILTVGSVADIPGGYTSSGQVVNSSFSSWGPTDDGRIKPDIVANGETVLSTSANGSYVTKSGTSMATPSVTGSIALLREHWQNLNGTEAPSASMLKSLVIHTADEAGPTPGPDYVNGWGLMNSEKAARLISRDHEHDGDFGIRETVLMSGQTREFQIFVPGGASNPLRVTAVWNDPAPLGVPAGNIDDPTPALLNDVDLRLISPNGSDAWHPWILNPTFPTNGAMTGDNTRDNVEQVFVESPASGIYTIRLTHKGGGLAGGLQPISLTISGATWIYNQEWTSSGAMDCAADGSTVAIFHFSDGTASYSRVVKIDAGGRELWSHTFAANHFARALCYDAAGNCVGAGTGNGSSWMFKLDGNGNLLWSQLSGGGDFLAVDTDASNNVVAAGNVAVPPANGLRDAYVEKRDANGNLLWTDSWDVPVGCLNYNNLVKLDAAGNIYAAGWCHTSVDMDVTCRKYSPAGAVLWSQQIDSPSGSDDEPDSMTLDSQNHVIIAGQADTGPGTNQRIMTVKVNGTTGVIMWLKRDAEISPVQYARGVCTDSSDNIYTCGTSMPSSTMRAVAISYNSAGTLRWTQLFGSTTLTSSFKDINFSASGQLYAVGTEYNGTNNLAIVKELNSATGAQVRTWSYAPPSQNTEAEVVMRGYSGVIRVLGKSALGGFVIEYGP
jgi:hypothetical protein